MIRWRARRLLRELFADTDTRVWEIGPVMQNDARAVWVEVNGFYRWYDIWVGMFVCAEQRTAYVCCLGFGIKLRVVTRDKIRS